MNNEMKLKISIGTLGDKEDILTCSLYMAYKRYDSQIIKIPFDSFEKAIEAVKNNIVDKCIIPVAYPNITNFITDLELDIQEVFLDSIPNLVLVGKNQEKPTIIDTVYLHPATKSILPVSLNRDSNIRKKFVTSNSEACRKLIDKPLNSVAITNELSSKYYKLHIYNTLRENMKMPFVVFSLKK